MIAIRTHTSTGLPATDIISFKRTKIEYVPPTTIFLLRTETDPTSKTVCFGTVDDG
jgi:hypothetical protein